MHLWRSDPEISGCYRQCVLSFLPPTSRHGVNHYLDERSEWKLEHRCELEPQPGARHFRHRVDHK